jgi:plasmid stabilization system protein ParE
MSFALGFEPEAREEMRVAGDWYELHQPGLGGRFAMVLDSCLEAIVSDPLRYPKAGPTTHKAKISGWPCSVYFTVLEERRLVIVVAVWHGSRNPAELRRRLK